MRHVLRHACSVFSVLALCLAAEAAAQSPALTGTGCSVSVPGYLAEIAREYEKRTGVRITLLGGGSVRGLSDLQAGRTDFAASCQGKSAGDPEEFEYHVASWDALVFIVNKANPVSDITPRQVRDIYEGRIANWRQLGGPDLKLISYITSPKGFGGVVEALQQFILGGAGPVVQKNSSLQASSPAIWEQLVEQTREGFASTGFSSARKRDVKMLTVDGVAPTRESIVSGRYPYRRPLYLVIKRQARPETREFVEFVLGKAGQERISSYGMPALTDVK